MTEFQGLHNFFEQTPDNLDYRSSGTRYITWIHGPLNQPHTTFMEHETFQFALKSLVLNVKKENLANLQVVEDIQNPYYARFFIFKFLGCSWFEMEGLNPNETFIVQITKEYAFLLE